MSWIAVAIGGTAVAGGVYKAVSGNQRSQRNKGYIEENYQMSKKRLGRQQEDVRQATTEGLIQRGLAQGGLTPIQRAMAGGGAAPQKWDGKGGVMGIGKNAAANQNATHEVAAAYAGTPHTLGEQLQVDNDEQFRLEQVDLEQKRGQAERENRADYLDTLVDAGLGTAQGIAGAFGARADIKGIQQSRSETANGSQVGIGGPANSPIQSAMMSGVDNPANHAFGVVGHDPLNAPGSSWNRKSRTVSGNGLSIDQFHV